MAITLRGLLRRRKSSPVCMLTLLGKVSVLGRMLTRWPFSSLYPVLRAVSGYTSEIKIKSGHDLEHCAATVQIFYIVSTDSGLILVCVS